MFDTEHVPMRVHDIAHGIDQRDGEEVHTLTVKFQINPCTAKLAGELDDFLRRTIYRVDDSEVNPKLKTATFDLSLPPQDIAIRTAPDQGKASTVLAEAEISPCIVSRSKKSSSWCLTFDATFVPRDKQMVLIDSLYTHTVYATFAENQAAGDLVDRASDARPRRAGGSTGAGEATQTH